MKLQLPALPKHGFMLIELALVLVLVAIILGPILHLLGNQRQKDKVTSQLQARQSILDAVEGFVLAHGRLPCPASQINGQEARTGDSCTQRDGWLPVSTLSTWGISGQWRMAVALLETAGEPAQNALVSVQPFAELSPQQLAEIVLAPYTVNHGAGTGPLPAIHLCQVIAGLAMPSNINAGCGGHGLLSASAVWVAYPEGDELNQHRYQQFFMNPAQPSSNPVWLTFERMNWLWMKRGSLDTFQLQEN